MPDKDQFGIYNDQQLSLLKNTFADNDTLLYTIRKVFLQFPLTEVEKGLIRTAVTPEVLEVLKIRMIPELSPVFPLGQLPSILTTLTNDLKVKNVEEMAPHFESKQLQIRYLETCFEVLESIVTGLRLGINTIRLTYLGTLVGKTPHEQWVDMTAYLFLLGYIDPSLHMIKLLAGEKEESPEQQKKRLMRDSSK